MSGEEELIQRASEIIEGVMSLARAALRALLLDMLGLDPRLGLTPGKE